MKFTDGEIYKIAYLAKLSIREEELPSIKKKLNRILNLVEKMDEIDTKNVEPLAHPLDESQPLREDQVTEINQRELFQKIAPEINAGLYIVPKVLENEEVTVDAS